MSIQLPEIFKGRSEYRGFSNALEMAQATFNEERIYLALAEFAKDWYSRTQHEAEVLDLCSATGLSALRIARSIPVSHVTLVDTDPEALKKGTGYFDQICSVTIESSDAITINYPGEADLVILNSAYHHIEDRRKVGFLKKTARSLSPNGEIIVGEHFLGHYSNDEQFEQRVVEFYTALIHDLKVRGESKEAISVIRQSAFYTWCREYEYKVSWDVFTSHIEQAKLSVDKVVRVWPEDSTLFKNENVGSLAIVLKHSR